MNSCAPNAICTNMPGLYKCSCYSGYFGDGFGNGTGCTAQKSHNQNIPLISGNQSTTPPLLSKCKLGFFKVAKEILSCCLLNASQHHDQVSPIFFPKLQQKLRTQMFVEWLVETLGRFVICLSTPKCCWELIFRMKSVANHGSLSLHP